MAEVQVGNRIYKLPPKFVESSETLTDLLEYTEGLIILPNFNIDSRIIYPSAIFTTRIKDMNNKPFKHACKIMENCPGCDNCDMGYPDHYISFKYLHMSIEELEHIEEYNIFPERDDYFGEMIDITMQFIQSENIKKCPGLDLETRELIPFIDFTRLMWMWEYLNMSEIYDYGIFIIDSVHKYDVKTACSIWSIPLCSMTIEDCKKIFKKMGAEEEHINNREIMELFSLAECDHNFKHIDEFLSEEYKEKRKLGIYTV